MRCAVVLAVAISTVGAPGAPAAQAATDDFKISYARSVPAGARTAFAYAANRWAAMLDIRVPVRVHVGWTRMPQGALGHMGPKAVLVKKRFRPTPLADSMLGRDLLPGVYDITGKFNSRAPWYFGTNGRPPTGRADFVSVAMHELGHGLGMIGSMTKDSGTGLGSRSRPPWIYDSFTANRRGRRLVKFASPSLGLGRQLTSGRLHWSGRKGVAYNGGVRPRLYAPSRWLQGTSYMHLNEATYRGRRNRLMTPVGRTGEVNHAPGPIVLGMFRDMGWRLGPAGRKIVARLTLVSLASSTSSIRSGGRFTLTGKLRRAQGGAAIAGKTLALQQRRIGTTRWRHVASRTTSATGTVAFSLRRRAGMQFRLRHARTATTDADMSPIRTVRVR